MSALGWVAAAYAVVLVTLSGYAWTLSRRERRLRDALARSGHGAPPRSG